MFTIDIRSLFILNKFTTKKDEVDPDALPLSCVTFSPVPGTGDVRATALNGQRMMTSVHKDACFEDKPFEPFSLNLKAFLKEQTVPKTRTCWVVFDAENEKEISLTTGGVKYVLPKKASFEKHVDKAISSLERAKGLHEGRNNVFYLEFDAIKPFFQEKHLGSWGSRPFFERWGDYGKVTYPEMSVAEPFSLLGIFVFLKTPESYFVEE